MLFTLGKYGMTIVAENRAEAKSPGRGGYSTNPYSDDSKVLYKVQQLLKKAGIVTQKMTQTKGVITAMSDDWYILECLPTQSSVGFILHYHDIYTVGLANNLQKYGIAPLSFYALRQLPRKYKSKKHIPASLFTEQNDDVFEQIYQMIQPKLSQAGLLINEKECERLQEISAWGYAPWEK